MLEQLEKHFKAVAPKADYVSLRYMSERNERVAVRQNVLQPVATSEDSGVMITVCQGRGIGYAATSDLSLSGLKEAAGRALAWAKKTADKGVTDFSKVPRKKVVGEYRTPVKKPWSQISLKDKIDMLKRECERLKTDPKIVDWQAWLWHTNTETVLLDTLGTRIQQNFEILAPEMCATANKGSETQTRTFSGSRIARQGGLEILDTLGYFNAAPRISSEALQLLEAPDCPTGEMDLILAQDQMILQIHESIGHPLELDRILGDERNYAGTSFVTLDMFGKYQYGSKLLNITFDPTQTDELASYGYDDDGLKAKKQFIIKDGILQRPLGGITSQARAGVDGVANSRATSWNRPPIDRMANLNLEPGDKTLEEMIQMVDKGVYMESNCSWSIDDSRNKFQFGCELGRLIEKGKLTQLVRKPNYRGISATFWRSLKAVGGKELFKVMGTPFCGKGEPNQIVRVGHASPPALFSNVQVFGGA